VADRERPVLEEKLVATIRQNHFHLLPFEDVIAFRYACESGYRRNWNEGGETDLMVVLRSPEASLRSPPYDLLHTRRALTFDLPDLFPKLSFPVISELDVAYLQPPYEAYQRYSGPEMGNQASALFALKHIFRIVRDTIKTRADPLKLLLSCRARGEQAIPGLDALPIKSFRLNRAVDTWPLEILSANGTDFFALLQGQWASYLTAQQPAAILAREVGSTYNAGDLLPFDEPDIRACVDTLFLEGKLKLISLPEDWTVDGWVQVGVKSDE